MIILTVSTLALLLISLFGSSGILIGFICIGGVIVVAALSAWLWQRPIRGIYVLVGTAAAIDVNYSATTSDGYFVAHYLPFWQDLTAWTNIHIIISLAELFLALLLIIFLLKSIATRQFHFDKGTMMVPIGLYMMMILIGEFHGIASGGNFTKSLWELRAQIYMFVAYILACGLIKTKKEIGTLTWVLLLSAGFRAIEGTFRYFVYFRGRSSQVIDVYPHEQAFFLNALITLTAIMFLYKAPSRLKRVALGLLPFAIFIDLATNRRAAVLSLCVGTILLLLVTIYVNPSRRRIASLILFGIILAFPPYYIIFQHRAGTLGGPARAIASNFSPDPRDAASNKYRDDESFDELATMRTNPIIGYGFGKPMLTPHNLADISKIYVWWNYMPHNSILWVWMRLGTIGYILFWFMIGSAVIQALRLLHRLRDPWFQGLALFVALMIVQEVLFGYLDLQWTNYRNLVTVGVLFALISRLTKIATSEEVLAPEHLAPPSVGKKRVHHRADLRSLAVVNGRLKRVSLPDVGA